MVNVPVNAIFMSFQDYWGGWAIGLLYHILPGNARAGSTFMVAEGFTSCLPEYTNDTLALTGNNKNYYQMYKYVTYCIDL
jgi:hypothetical protein